MSAFLARALLPIALAILLSSCAAVPRGPGPPPPGLLVPHFAPYATLDENLPVEIKDYEGKVQGLPLPAWLAAYLGGGPRAVEALPNYRDLQCFVIEWTGPALPMLRARAASYTDARDLPTAVYRRVYARLTQALVASPDIVYGSAFQTLTQALVGAPWPPTARSEGCWTRIGRAAAAARYPEASALRDSDSGNPFADAYRVYHLVALEKAPFQSQFLLLSASIHFDKRDSQSQTQAYQAATSREFFEGF
ncbi:MAG: hypothetical protein LBS82_05495 [Spirochaetaceae bacterium]|jgi:hypothetical protein|nr:hypothetical protein [Spirochaetaceae bacterium]